MGATKSHSCTRLSWVLALLVSVFLSAPLVASAQVTEATEPADDDEEPSVCEAWGRPGIVPVEGSKLSIEVQCVIGGTYLLFNNTPGPDEDPDLLRRYLRQEPYEQGKMGDGEYRAVMEEAVRLWPQSQYAHAGLAFALLGGRGVAEARSTLADKRRATDEFLIAAEIAFKDGKLPDELDYSPTMLLARLGDKATLDRYFERVFKLLPEGKGRYQSYNAYAYALDELGDERADTYFQKASAVSPKAVVGNTYNSYAYYLLRHRRAQAVLALLAPESKAERALSKLDFYFLRCRALEQVGQKAEAAVACQQARDLTPAPQLPSPAEGPAPGPSARNLHVPAEPGLLARLFGTGLAYADYQNPDEDCTGSQPYQKCRVHPEDGTLRCYYDFTWNLAELRTLEAGVETYGARAAVGWTVRDRVDRVSSPGCGNFKADTTCATECPDPQHCDLQKKYCCVIRSGQFKYEPTAVKAETIRLAADIVNSKVPEPTSGFAPTGAGVCTTGVCDDSLACVQNGSNYDEYAPEGPIYFYANCRVVNGVTACDPTYYGFQPGVDTKCNVVAKETCGYSTDGVGPDNCFGRATRARKWKAGPDFVGSTGVTTAGDTKRLPPGTWVYRDDSFKNPGGKAVFVEARLETAGPTTFLRIHLKNSASAVIHDFGTKGFGTAEFMERKFVSQFIVTSPASQVTITDQGPGVLIVQQVKAQDRQCPYTIDT